jgi:exosortase
MLIKHRWTGRFGRIHRPGPKGGLGNLRQTKGKLSLSGEQVRGSRVNFENPSSLVQVAAPVSRRLAAPANLIFALGCVLLILPTMFQVARDSWSSEQGGHGPLVLATGIWALWRELNGKKIETRPGKLIIALPIMAVMLGVFIVARITGVLEVEGFAMYGALITAAYTLFGASLLRAAWFPLVYLAFTLPPPDTVVAAVTQPIKIAISSSTVSVLSMLGYPIASSGVTIQMGQYQLLIAAACAGLNSIVTLSALCLFYVYLRHRSNPVAFVVIALAAIPVAIISNFVRVMALVLITYHFGDAVAQGFVHDFAGLTMFAVALLVIFGVDQLAAPLFTRGDQKAHS